MAIPQEDEVLKRMLRTPPKPHPKPADTDEPRRRGRPMGVRLQEGRNTNAASWAAPVGSFAGVGRGFRP